MEQIKNLADQQTLREQITDSLREALVNGDLKPGQRVQEIELATQYKTSRTPVREALRQLEAEGFVKIRPRRGAIVAPITVKDIREFYELKGLLESYAAERAVNHITDEEIDQMDRLNKELKRMYANNNVIGMVDTHNKFHEIFVHASGNERLAGLIGNLVNQYQRFRIALSYTESMEESIEIHDEIVSAYRLRDSDHVSKLVRKNSVQGAEALIQRLMIVQ